MKKMSPPPCRRCGTCCKKGGPALHGADLPLLSSGHLPRRQLVTLRRGETVRENVSGGLVILDCEMVKIAGTGSSWTCSLYHHDHRACLIHAHRPVECQALSCEAPEALAAIYASDRLTRADIIGRDGALWELITFHEQTFPATTACALARAAVPGVPGATACAATPGAPGAAARPEVSHPEEALLQLAEMIDREHAFRAAIKERTQATEAELDFYFGRSLAVLAQAYGLRPTAR